MMVLMYSVFAFLSIWCINRFEFTTITILASVFVAAVGLIGCINKIFMLSGPMLVILIVWACYKITVYETADWGEDP